MARIIVGIIILFFGLATLFALFNLAWFFATVVFPLLCLLVGIFLWHKGRKVFGAIAIAFGVLSLSHHLFDLDVAGLAIAALMIYFGFRLLKPPSKKEKEWETWEDWELTGDGPENGSAHETNGQKHGKPHGKYKLWQWDDEIDREVEKLIQKGKTAFRQGRDWVEHHIHHKYFNQNGKNAHGTPHSFGKDHPLSSDQEKEAFSAREKGKGKRYETFSIIGDFNMHYHRFELTDMKVTNGIGDVKIDLSKAVIPPGETSIEISVLLGNVQIYVPYELEVAVQANVFMGTLDLLGHHQDGIARSFATRSAGYEQAAKKVKINVSLGLGDIDVRYV